jgi:tetratricopeptide (TPR) repeat protein
VALRHLAFLGWNADAPTSETELLEEALANARTAGDRREIGWGLLSLSQVLLVGGDMTEARRLADEALATLRGLDARSRMNVSLQLGRVALAQGDYTYAESVFRETVHHAHEIGERFKLADPWFGLAVAVRARGDLVGARGCFRQLVSELRAAACGHLLPRVVVGLAMFEAGVDNHLQAARLLGAFDAAGGTTIGWPLEGYYLGPDVATLLALFEERAFAVAMAEGRERTVDEALNDALADGEAADSNVLVLDSAGLSATY